MMYVYLKKTVFGQGWTQTFGGSAYRWCHGFNRSRGL